MLDLSGFVGYETASVSDSDRYHHQWSSASMDTGKASLTVKGIIALLGESEDAPKRVVRHLLDAQLEMIGKAGCIEHLSQPRRSALAALIAQQLAILFQRPTPSRRAQQNLWSRPRIFSSTGNRRASSRGRSMRTMMMRRRQPDERRIQPEHLRTLAGNDADTYGTRGAGGTRAAAAASAATASAATASAATASAATAAPQRAPPQRAPPQRAPAPAPAPSAEPVSVAVSCPACAGRHRSHTCGRERGDGHSSPRASAADNQSSGRRTKRPAPTQSHSSGRRARTG